MTDLQEFLAGTDPTDNGSVLSVLRLTSPGSSSTTLLWAAVPGRTYRVQFKGDLGETGWTDLPGLVTATGTTGVKADTSADGSLRRFYRVVMERDEP